MGTILLLGGLKMSKIYKNWTVHNLIGHPFMQLAYLVRAKRVGDWIHNSTLPKGHEHE